MEPERWQRLWTLFHAALECPAGEERERFLTASCGADSALRAELDSHLATHEADATSAPLVALPFYSGKTHLLDAAPGSRIGPYRILRTIGEGGMGRVYEALQEEPVRRRVQPLFAPAQPAANASPAPSSMASARRFRESPRSDSA